jgi:phage terminase large subunit-like protein
MSSRAAVLTGSQEPRVHLQPKTIKWSEADDAAFLATSYGLTPDPWQILVLHDWLGRKVDGKWAAGRCGLSVPRQNGKNGVIEVRELYGMVALGERFLHTAHEVKTARKAFQRLKHFFGESANDPAAKYPDLNALVKEVRNTNGQEAIVLKDSYDEDGRFVRAGGAIEFVARSRGSGRGYTVDVLVLDEAQELTDEQLEALQSTISSAPLGNPQTILTGTPPGPTSPGEVFSRVRAGGVSGKNKRLSWIEWSVDERAVFDLYAPATWASTNPSLGLRLQRSVIEDELPPDGLSEAGFSRERLGMWASAETMAVIPLDAWRDLAVDAPPTGFVGYYSLAVSPERMAFIGVAIADGEKRFLDLPADGYGRMDDSRKIIDWFVARKRNGRKVRVAIDSRDPAAALVNELRANKILVNVISQSDSARACGGLYNDVQSRTVTHFGQKVIEDGLTVARKKLVGKAGQWEWDPQDDSDGVTAVRAITLARFGLTLKKQPSGDGRRTSGRRAVSA